MKAERVFVLFILCVTLVQSTHFRYGHLTWEKVLTHPVPSEYKVRVSYDVGGRWSFPYGSGTSTCPPPPFVATGATGGSGNCPPVGRTIAFGTVTFNKAVKVNTATTAVTATAMNTVVTSIISERDLFYGSFSFEMTFPVTSNPVTVTWNNCCRLSQILQGNNDQNWRLLSIIDAAPPNTKSPKSASLPLISVTTGRNNSLFFPSQSFDNNSNRFRISTTAESQLPRITPTGFTLSSNVQGAAVFFPGSNGLYAVQMMITSFDGSGVARASAPLDLLLEATPFSPTAPTLTLSTDSPLTSTVGVGSAIIIDVTAVLSPANSAYAVSVSNTPLPAGATVTPLCTVCNGATPTVYQFEWTPTLTSVSSVVCFQSIAQNTVGSTVVSPGMLCHTINIGALPTTLTAFPASGVCGGPVTVVAQLTRTVDGAPLSSRPISFSLQSSILCSPPTLTNSTGYAACTFVPAATGTLAYDADFLAVVNEFVQSRSSSNVVSIRSASTSLDAPTVTSLASVGYALQGSVVLNRVFTDGGLFAPPGEVVDFTLTSPSSSAASQTSGTVVGPAGLASVTFGPLSEVGVHTLHAFFAGSACLIGPAGSPTTSFTVYQRTQISISSAPAPTCGQGFVVSAHLMRIPDGSGVSGVSVSFSFSGGGVPAQTATTDGNGDVSVTFIVSQAVASVNAFATFNLFGTFANRDGTLSPETASTSFAIGQGETTLTLNAPTSGTVTIPLPAVSATLTNNLTPVAAANLLFSLAAPGGGVVTRNGVTDAGGVAVVSVPFVPSVTGVHQMTVSYAGNSCLSAATSAPPTSISVGLIVPTQLAANALSGTCSVPFTATARLTSTVGAPISGQMFTFSNAADGGVLCMAGPTDVNGFASCATTPSNSGTFSYVVTFDGVPGLYSPSTLSRPLSVARSATWLSSLSVVGANMVGETITVSTTLSRPAGPIPAAPVQVTYAGTTSAAVTGGDGRVSVAFSTAARGVYGILVSYGGDGCSEPAITNATVTVFQKTYLIVNDAHGFCGDSTTISAGLHSISGTGSNSTSVLAGETVSFSLSGNPVPDSGAAVTDVLGVASISVSYSLPGLYVATAVFSNLAGYFVDESGNPIPTQSSANVFIAGATSALSSLPLPPIYFVGDTIPLASTLSRVTHPAGGIGGMPIAFTFGAETVVGHTDASGTASAPALASSRGAKAAAAHFAGDSCLLPSSTPVQSVDVYQRATVAFGPAAPSLTCGSPGSVVATLAAGAGVGGEEVVFDFLGVLPGQTVVTDLAGMAVAGGLVFGSAGVYVAHVSFENIADYFADRNGLLEPDTSMTLLSVSSADTQLTLGTAMPAFLVVVGETVHLSAQLQRTTAPAAPIVGAALSISGLPAVTDVAGRASVMFGASSKGPLMGLAHFSGDSCLRPASATNIAATVYQRTQLTLFSGRAFDDAIACGQPFSLTAQLLTEPGGVAVVGEAVNFGFGGAIPPQTALTDSLGVATVTGVFTDAGSFAVQASFYNPFAYYADHEGHLPPVAETAVGTATIVPALTSLSTPLLSSSSAFVGDVVSASATLTRISAPAGVVAGNVVTFALSDGDGNLVSTTTAITASDGSAATSFTLTIFGELWVSASFDGDSCLLASSASSLTPVTCTQQVTLALAPIKGTCGEAVSPVVSMLLVPQNAPMAGAVLTIAGASQQCYATTDVSGVASCALTPTVGGAFAIAADFSMPFHTPAHADSTATVTKTAVTLSYVGSLTLANRRPTLLSASLQAENGPVVGRNVTISIGQGITQQSCWGITDSDGVARCTPLNWLWTLFSNRFRSNQNPSACVGVVATIVKILKDAGRNVIGDVLGEVLSSVVGGGGAAVLAAIANLKTQLWQPLGPGLPISLFFAGDDCYLAAVGNSAAIVFEYLPAGTFAVGDLSSSPHYFYGPLWAQKNPMSRRNATTITDFEGYAGDMRSPVGQRLPNAAVCNGYYNSNRDQKLPKERDIPEYFAAVVSSSTAYNPSTGSGGSLGVTYDCTSTSCQYGGTCINNYGGGFFCLCPPNRRGTRCEKSGPPSYGNGNGALPHGTGDPGDTTGDVARQIILEYTQNSYPNAATGRFVAHICP